MAQRSFSFVKNCLQQRGGVHYGVASATSGDNSSWCNALGSQVQLSNVLTSISAGSSIPQRQWRKLPLPFPSPSFPFPSPPLSLSLPFPFPPFPSLPPLAPFPGVWGQSPQWRESGVQPPEKNGNWNRIWCILAHFCFKTAAIQCFTYTCKEFTEV